MLRAAAGRLAPDAETEVTLRKQEVAVRDLAIRAEVHPDPEICKTAGYFRQKTTELHALNRSVEEIRTRLVTQIDRAGGARRSGWNSIAPPRKLARR